MTGQGMEAMQVLCMEIEGIKIAIQLAKDAVRVAWQLAKFIFCTIKKNMQDAKYRKVYGKTNLKNLLARANGQPLTPCTMDRDTYERFVKLAKKSGVLFYSFHPLKTGKGGSMQVLFSDRDLPVVQDLMSMIREERIRKEAKQGRPKDTAGQEFSEHNRTQTMEEFAANVGADAPEEAFEAAMKERFGENYEEELGVKEELKKAFAGGDKKMEEAAGIVNFKERAEELKKDKAAEVSFVYDEKKGKSQIIDETETHVKIAVKGLFKGRTAWNYMWVPKNSVMPPLDAEPGKDGMRTAELRKGTDVAVEDASGKEAPVSIKAEELPPRQDSAVFGNASLSRKKEKVIVDAEYRIMDAEPQKQESFDITISKELFHEENDRAVKTRVPGTWGKNIRFLWIEKENTQEVLGGKSVLTMLAGKETYQLYDADGAAAERMTGEELYRRRYEPAIAGAGKPDWERGGMAGGKDMLKAAAGKRRR